MNQIAKQLKEELIAPEDIINHTLKVSTDLSNSIVEHETASLLYLAYSIRAIIKDEKMSREELLLEVDKAISDYIEMRRITIDKYLKSTEISEALFESALYVYDGNKLN